MEEAKIGGQTPVVQEAPKPIFQDSVPGIVSADELVFEIGKHVVRALNNEMFAKKIQEQYKKAQETINLLTKQLDILPELKKKNEDLIRSNRAYESRNHEMAEALDVSRKEVEKLTAQLSPQNFQLGKLEGQLESAEDEIERLNKIVALRDQSISALQSKIKKLETTKKSKTA